MCALQVVDFPSVSQTALQPICGNDGATAAGAAFGAMICCWQPSWYISQQYSCCSLDQALYRSSQSTRAVVVATGAASIGSGTGGVTVGGSIGWIACGATVVSMVAPAMPGVAVWFTGSMAMMALGLDTAQLCISVESCCTSTFPMYAMPATLTASKTIVPMRPLQQGLSLEPLNVVSVTTSKLPPPSPAYSKLGWLAKAPRASPTYWYLMDRGL
mmetsp:Transcript_76693/g.197528  ORF Transcript_76693/g.197528 Transcript_76693/m.197528 type:complete len:215 (+) Transcript_76693:961-1605(+)